MAHITRGPAPSVLLADGTPLVRAIAERGLNRATVMSRVYRGFSPDDAINPDLHVRGRRPRLLASDGKPIASKLHGASVARESVYRRIRRGVPPDDALG